MVVLDKNSISFGSFPICDTNILINFGLINKLSEFVKFKTNIFVADVVKKELDRKIGDSDNYKFIAETVEINDDILLIDKNYFEEEKLCVMNANLNEYELEQNCLLTDSLCPNLGEFVSAIYAANLGIKVFITHDMTFINKYKEEEIFKNLSFKNMAQALDSFVGQEKRKEYLKKIRVENKEMVDELNQEKVLNLFEKWQANISS